MEDQNVNSEDMPCVPVKERKRDLRKKLESFFFAMLLTGAGWIAKPVFAEEAPPPASGEPPKAEAPAAAAAPAPAPKLPAYFTATNDPQKPSWPDPTGGAAGVWATPAGDGKG
jgi:hypothetical protein